MNKKNLFYVFAITMVAMLSVGFASCSSDDEDEAEKPIDTSSVILFADDTKVIDGNVLKSSSEDSFVASVKNSIITANHVGQTSIIVNDKYKIPVTVMPKYVIMTSEPILDWGISKEEVKSRWKLGTLKETGDILAYYDCGDATLVGYSFKNGKLNGVTIGVSTSKGIKFTNYLTERFFISPYEVNDQYLGFDAYEKDKAKTTIVYDASGSYKVGSTKVYLCTYMPAKE